jgi:hypothetical protein
LVNSKPDFIELVFFFQIPEEEEVLTDDECFIASLLSHFLEVYQFNTHEVAQVEPFAKQKL